MAHHGHIWVEGDQLCFIDDAGNKKCGTGSTTGNSGSPGYMWISGDKIHYTDNEGNERRLDNTNLPGGTGEDGHMWLETDTGYIRFVGSGGSVVEWYHADHSNTHSNHHGNTTPHGDSHENGHANAGDPGHVQYCHTNTHSNHGNHSNTTHHTDHSDAHSDSI